MTESAFEQRTNFEDAHAPLALEMFDETGEPVQIPAERLPKLLNWTVLLTPWVPPKRTRGGVLLPETVQEANEYLTNVFRVVAIGPLAFTHARLRGGPRRGWRKNEPITEHPDVSRWQEYEFADFAEDVPRVNVGDWVIVRRYAGITLELDGVPLKMCNDDDLLAVIDSPNGWKAYIA